MSAVSVGFWLSVEAPATFRALRYNARELEAVSQRRLGHILGAARRTPLYRRRVPARRRDSAAVLRDLAPVTKSELLAAGDDALLEGCRRSTWHTSLSSGSTDEPFRAYFDARAWAMLKYLVKLRARVACGVRPALRTAVLEPILPRGPAPDPVEHIARARRFSTMTSDHDMAHALATYQPHVLCGWPSELQRAAAVTTAAGVRISPMFIFASGEPLLPGARAALVQAYGCPVHDIYGTSETKEIAWECPSGGMHINTDVVLVEVLDQEGRRLPPGDEGRVVVTVLVNEAMPLIRYCTGDRGSLRPEQCACGVALPLLGRVTGREAETLELAGQTVSPYVLTCAVERAVGAARYEIVQLGADRLLVRTVGTGDADRATLSDAIRAALRGALPSRVDVAVEWVAGFPAEAGLKRRVIVPLTGASHRS